MVTIVEASPANAGALLDELMRLHQARWTERGEPGVFADPQVGTFHRDAVPRLLAAGLLRLEALVIGGAVAAASYALVHRDRVYHYLTGFDAAFAFESPGALLLEHAILRARAEGAREFHLLRGNEAYKYASGAEDRLSSRRVFRRRSTLAEAS